MTATLAAVVCGATLTLSPAWLMRPSERVRSHASSPGAAHVSSVSRVSEVASWTATDIDGHRWSANALRGQVVVVDFWATWCAPCLEELPRLKRLHTQHGSRGLTIIGVSMDRSTSRDFRSWLQRQAIAWPQVREAGGFDGPLARAFDIEAVPASFVFARDGRLEATGLRGVALETRVAALMERR